MFTKASRIAPGLVIAGIAVFCSFVISWQWSSVSPLTVSLLIGALMGNLGLIPPAGEPGLAFASRHILRTGIVLLGFQLSFSEVAHLGGRGFLAVIAVVIVTFFRKANIVRFTCKSDKGQRSACQHSFSSAGARFLY